MNNAQMKKGILEMCILYQFLSADYYGYDLIEKMKQYFPDVKDSVFYVILRRLCAEGCTDAYTGSESGGPTRKYYKITPSGRTYLDGMLAEWSQIKRCIEEMGIDF